MVVEWYKEKITTITAITFQKKFRMKNKIDSSNII